MRFRAGFFKRTISLLLVISIIVLLFVSCGKDGESQEDIDNEKKEAEYIINSVKCVYDLQDVCADFPIDLDEFNRLYAEVEKYTGNVSKILSDFENNHAEILKNTYNYECIPAYSEQCDGFFHNIDTYVKPAAEKGTSLSIDYGQEKYEEILVMFLTFGSFNIDCFGELYTVLEHKSQMENIKDFSAKYVSTDDYILSFSASGIENDLTDEYVKDVLVDKNLNRFHSNQSVHVDIDSFFINLKDKDKTNIEIYIADVSFLDDNAEIQKDTYYFKFETDECTETLSIAGYLNQESGQIVILQPYEKLIVSDNKGSVVNTQTQENMVVLENYDSIYKYYGYIREDDADFSNQYLELENPITVHSQYDDRVYENVRKIYFFEEDFPTYKVDEFAEVSGVIFDYRDGGEFYFENPEIK